MDREKNVIPDSKSGLKLNLTSTDSEETHYNDHVTVVEQQTPEGGWGWLVVFGSFLAHLIIGGFMRCGGVIFLRLEERFSQPAADTAWAVSLHITLRLLLGPIASALCNRFSCRTAVMVGGLATTVGVLISGYTPNLWFLYFSNGLLTGFGQALIYTASVVVVGLYFHRRRGTAVGIANAGIGAGTFIFPPLMEVLFTHYGFQGAFLIMSGFAFNFCVCSALYRSLSLHEKIIGKQNISEVVKEINITETGRIRLDVPLSRDHLNALSFSSLCYDIHISNNNFMDLTDKSKNSQLYSFNSRYGSDNVIRAKLVNVPLLSLRARSGSDVTRSTKHTVGLLSDSTKSLPNTYTKYAPDNSHGRQIVQSPLAETKNISEVEADVIELDDSDDVSATPNSKILDWSPLKDIRFATLCIGIGFFTLSFQSSFVFLPPLVAQKGLEEIEGAYLVSITGAIETIGSITLGMILDMRYFRNHILELYTVANVILGICTFIMPFLENFIALSFVCGVYGYFLGGCLAQKATLVVHIIGLDQLISAFGILVCFQGLGTLIGPPFAGFLKDLSGRYDEGFYLGSAMLIGAAVVQTFGIVVHALRRSTDS